MTVEELIETLKEYEPNDEVLRHDSEHDDVPITYIEKLYSYCITII